ncbi:MAG TPA: hypothetical protein PKW90_25270, partial [Myxococcota bacterium]|nr:hypothetical protein [Myxococcota bacterium]
LDLQAQVKLLGAPKRNGRAPTLARGTVFGQVAWGAGGDLVLSGRDKDVVVARGDILIGGGPVDIELPNPETGEPMVGVPPVVVLHATSNGKGTRNTASNTGQTQSTDLL